MTSDNGVPTAKPAPFGLLHDAWGQLVFIDAQGRRHEGATPVRAFPLSDPSHWVSICDSAGREIVCIEDLAQLSPQVRETLESDLARREFMPVIKRVLMTTGDTEPCEWEVETDRGSTRFVLNSEDDVRRIGPHSGMVIDSHGIRYLIADITQLDPASQRIIEAYL